MSTGLRMFGRKRIRCAKPLSRYNDVYRELASIDAPLDGEPALSRRRWMFLLLGMPTLRLALPKGKDTTSGEPQGA